MGSAPRRDRRLRGRDDPRGRAGDARPGDRRGDAPGGRPGDRVAAAVLRAGAAGRRGWLAAATSRWCCSTSASARAPTRARRGGCRRSLPATARPLEIVSFDRDLEALTLASAHAESLARPGRRGGRAPCWRAANTPAARTRWRMVHAELPRALARAPAADVVFWDPFSPRANPELWRLAAFTALRALLPRRRDGAHIQRRDGVRSALLLAGFAVGVGVATGEYKAATCAALWTSRISSDRWTCAGSPARPLVGGVPGGRARRRAGPGRRAPAIQAGSAL
jgi:hypothetical protein